VRYNEARVEVGSALQDGDSRSRKWWPGVREGWRRRYFSREKRRGEEERGRNIRAESYLLKRVGSPEETG
jgi:hypothetical protein